MPEAPTTSRATKEEKEARVMQAVNLRLQGATPHVVLARLVEDHGLSIRHARRYLAEANYLIRHDEDGENIPPPADPFTDTANMALQRLQLQLLEATPSELPRLITALAKLREVMSNGPSLSDSDLINRAAFEGGLAALGAREGSEPR